MTRRPYHQAHEPLTAAHWFAAAALVVASVLGLDLLLGAVWRAVWG